MGRLDQLDLTASLHKEEYEERLYIAQRKLLELRLDMAGLLEDPELGPGVLVVLEGSDAGGKGGTLHCPWLLLPNAATRPSLRKASECCAPAAIAV